MKLLSRKKLTLVAVVPVVWVLAGTASAKYSGGTGEPNYPYCIADANDMNEIGAHPNDWDKHFLLTADINLADYTGTQFNIIGPNSMTPFTGVFDGNDHTIRNFTYTSTGTGFIGLFGCVHGVIKDLTLIDPNVDAGTGRYVGSLVGGLVGSITSCYAKGGSVSGDDYVGGLTGLIVGGPVINCYATCSVSGDADIGGLVGNNHGNIFRCYSAGSVTGTTRVGGLVGMNIGGIFRSASIYNCYARGSVLGDNLVGGLVGYNNQSALIRKCYSTGSVWGNSNAGGLVGGNDNLAPDSFWDIESSDCNSSDGGTGLPTAQMKVQSTFTDAGWDFVQTWGIEDNQTYPFLRLSYPVGDVDLDKDVDWVDFALMANNWLVGVE